MDDRYTLYNWDCLDVMQFFPEMEKARSSTSYEKTCETYRVF